MKKLSVLLLTLSFNVIIFAQCNGRYQTEIFDSANIISNIYYSDILIDDAHTMDIYTPKGDGETNRPVILYMHGGSFYGGSKTMTDCVDFCESMAKRGYVAASLNYRLSTPWAFLASQEEQYETVLKAVADIKAGIRFFRKNHALNNNTYGIDPSAIFIGGYSAGGVISTHLAFIDDINDLPTSPINVQNLVSIIGDLEGDAGNYGYSSNVQGVISFAGGINDVAWIDANDEPLVSIQGDADMTVNYNCGPGMNNPLVLNLCGAGEMHPQSDLVGLLNDKLVFSGEGHAWAANGNSNSKFLQALDFVTDFLFPILPCNNTTYNHDFTKNKKSLVGIFDIFGRPSKEIKNSPLFYLYSDKSVEYKIIIK